jgi:hypothetical protein
MLRGGGGDYFQHTTLARPRFVGIDQGPAMLMIEEPPHRPDLGHHAPLGMKQRRS